MIKNIKKIIINIYFILQTISFTLKDDIYILIEKESDLEKIDFHEEILSTGKVIFYKNKTQRLIESKIKQISSPNTYNSILINDKYTFLFYFIIYKYYPIRFLENCIEIRFRRCNI